jgi:hypothetical protein
VTTSTSDSLSCTESHFSRLHLSRRVACHLQPSRCSSSSTSTATSQSIPHSSASRSSRISEISSIVTWKGPAMESTTSSASWTSMRFLQEEFSQVWEKHISLLPTEPSCGNLSRARRYCTRAAQACGLADCLQIDCVVTGVKPQGVFCEAGPLGVFVSQVVSAQVVFPQTAFLTAASIFQTACDTSPTQLHLNSPTQTMIPFPRARQSASK